MIFFYLPLGILDGFDQHFQATAIHFFKAKRNDILPRIKPWAAECEARKLPLNRLTFHPSKSSILSETNSILNATLLQLIIKKLTMTLKILMNILWMSVVVGD